MLLKNFILNLKKMSYILIFRHVSASDRIGKLYRNQGNLFAIDDSNADEIEENNTEIEIVSLKEWLDKPDLLQKFKCFYRQRNSKGELEWKPG